MLAIGVQGMFFLPKVLDSPMLLNRFVLPTVVVGKSIDGIQCDTITMDNYQAGILAAEHLLQINCASCCYVGHVHNLGTDRRHAGFETRIRNSACRLTSILIDSPGDEQLRGYLRQTLAELPRPIGIFCYTDIFAVEVLRHIRSLGWSIPDEIRIIGCDNLPQSLANTPPLTTIHYNCSSLAQGGMKRMLERLNNRVLLPCNIMISPSLFIRESTGGK
jgi:LacI family transcriptional regulator